MRRRILSTAAALALIVGATAAPCAAYADEARDRQWYLSALRINEAHAISQGEGVTVAVIDSGVDAQHPDLVGNVLPGKNMTGANDNGWLDPTGHGTAMAAVIAGHGHGPNGNDGMLGIAPKAKILPITVPEGSLTQGKTYMTDAINWAVEQGAQIINISMSGGYDDPTEALMSARDAGVTVVVSAGNVTSAHKMGVTPLAGGGDVIAVTATDERGEFADVSLYGSEVSTSAPGVNMVAPVDRTSYRYDAAGTSSPAAIVSGTFALVKAKYPADTWKDLGIRVLSHTVDKGTPGRDSYYGYGAIDPMDALTGAPKALPSPTFTNPYASASQTAPPKAIASNDTAPTPSNAPTILIAAVTLIAVAAVVITLVAVRRRRGRGAQRGGTP